MVDFLIKWSWRKYRPVVFSLSGTLFIAREMCCTLCCLILKFFYGPVQKFWYYCYPRCWWYCSRYRLKMELHWALPVQCLAGWFYNNGIFISYNLILKCFGVMSDIFFPSLDSLTCMKTYAMLHVVLITFYHCIHSFSFFSEIKSYNANKLFSFTYLCVPLVP